MAAGSRMVGWFMQTFRHCGSWVMLTLLHTLFQLQLDYCSQLWSPSDQGSINCLEAVQHNFLCQAWVPVLEQLDYWERLKLLRLYRQERRQDRYMVCFLWKLSRGLISGYKIQWQRSDRQGLYEVPALKPMFETLEKSKQTQARLNTAGRNLTQFRNLN